MKATLELIRQSLEIKISESESEQNKCLKRKYDRRERDLMYLSGYIHGLKHGLKLINEHSKQVK